MKKMISSLREVIAATGLSDGMCISFHHHLRGGDYVLNMVMDEIAAAGIKDLTVNASSLFDCHLPLVSHIKSGVVTGLETNYVSAAIGKELSAGVLKQPVIFRSHGLRASDIVTGRSVIDVAFIAAPTSDPMGNCTGKIGPSACGSLGYAYADAEYAKKTVIITDNLVSYPLQMRSIQETNVDYVVVVDSIGDPQGIVSGTTKMPKDPIALRIAEYAAKAIESSGLLRDGFSFQTGAGGASLAVAGFLKEIMLKKGIKGSFALGGITGYLVDMMEQGCFQSLQDVQCFDLKAVDSICRNPNHIEISAAQYASPTAKSTAANSLDVVVLGATQIDKNFNVNVHTDSSGYLMGGSGGHTDVAACAKLTIIVAPLSRARTSIVVDKVKCVSTPGESIDLLVTEYGITVNPLRTDLLEVLAQSKLPIVSIQQLLTTSVALNGIPEETNEREARVIGEVYNRDNRMIDVIYQIL